jgi:hypothetical protein
MSNDGQHAVIDDESIDVPESRINGRTPTWKQFRLEAVLEDPVSYRLHWDGFKDPVKCPHGFITLTAAQLEVPKAVRTQAFAQAVKYIPKWFNRENWLKWLPWLMSSISIVQPPMEERKGVVLAEILLERLRKAHTSKNDEPDIRGTIHRDVGTTRMSDGSFWLKVSNLLSEIQRTFIQIKPGEVSKLLTRIGAFDKQRRINGYPHRFKVIDAAAFTELEKIAMGSVEVEHRSAEAPLI